MGLVNLTHNRSFIKCPIGTLPRSIDAQGACHGLLGRDGLPMTDNLRRLRIAAPQLNPILVLKNSAKGIECFESLLR